MKSSKKMLLLIGLLFFMGLLAIATISPETALVCSLPLVFGTTLAANKPRNYELGDVNAIPMIAADIIYEGAAVGVVKASGHARPLTLVDRFVGFAEDKADNSAGAAADINVRVKKKGVIQLSVSGAVITDIDQPVYATDDDVFVFLPTGGVFIGFIRRFVSSGVVIVEYDVDNFVDPYDGRAYETLAAGTLTQDLEDSGKTVFCTIDTVITLPATAVDLDVKLVNMGPYGTVQISASPAALDKFIGANLTGIDDKDRINTKATAQRGDFIHIKGGHADGYIVLSEKGIWAQQA